VRTAHTAPVCCTCGAGACSCRRCACNRLKNAGRRREYCDARSEIAGKAACRIETDSNK
jgi:hypothetical protein